MNDAVSDLVVLDRDHPGFRDPVYRKRRNAIAQIAIDHQRGDPIPDAPYSEEEHGVWREVWRHLAPLHEARACRRYLDAEATLGLPRDRIPQLSEVNNLLGGAFTMMPAPGLVTPRRFMMELARNGFLSTQYVRHHSQPLYTPEPDVIHELVGHSPTLLEPRFAAVNRAFGEAMKRISPDAVDPLINLYWYTIEFGLAREAGETKAYGAGLLSSFGELGTFEQRSEIVPFDLQRMIQTPFDPSDYQPLLFVADDIDQAFDAVMDYLAGTGEPAA